MLNVHPAAGSEQHLVLIKVDPWIRLLRTGMFKFGGKRCD